MNIIPLALGKNNSLLTIVFNYTPLFLSVKVTIGANNLLTPNYWILAYRKRLTDTEPFKLDFIGCIKC
jgi:hypothetical protein